MFLRHERGELRALRCELLKQRSGLRICAGGCTMPGGSEAGERSRLLPQNEIVHSGCYAGIGFAIGVGKTEGTREEILHRAEERSAVFVAHGRRRLRDLRRRLFRGWRELEAEVARLRASCIGRDKLLRASRRGGLDPANLCRKIWFEFLKRKKKI